MKVGEVGGKVLKEKGENDDFSQLTSNFSLIFPPTASCSML